jgi:CHAD domain-containing protein
MAANTTETSTRYPARARQAPAAQAAAAQAPADRALMAARPRADLPVAGTKPPRSASAAEVVQAYLRLQVAALRSQEPRVRADELDAVHQMRVATRRLRAAFRSFGTVIPRPETEPVMAELRWLGTALGEARDNEVLSGHLQASLRPVPVELLIGPVSARVQGHYAPRRAAAHSALIEALGSPRYAALLASLDRLAQDPPPGPQAADPARDVLPAAVRRAYRQARWRMRKARHAPPGPARDLALHRARKSARRARYAAEAARPAIGKRARRFARQMRKVQSVLGDHQDSVLARQAARNLGIAAHLAGENAFTYGLLQESERHRADRLQARARHVWHRASRSRYRRWMR